MYGRSPESSPKEQRIHHFRNMLIAGLFLVSLSLYDLRNNRIHIEEMVDEHFPTFGWEEVEFHRKNKPAFIFEGGPTIKNEKLKQFLISEHIEKAAEEREKQRIEFFEKLNTEEGVVFDLKATRGNRNAGIFTIGILLTLYSLKSLDKEIPNA